MDGTQFSHGIQLEMQKVLVQRETQEEFRSMGPWETLKSHSAIPGKCWVTKRLIFKIFNDSHFYIWGCSHELQQQRTTFRSWSSLYSRWVRGQTQMGKFGSKQSYPLSHLSSKACIFLKKISNSKHWVSHSEHRKIIILS